MMLIKGKMAEGMIMISSSAEEIPLELVGVKVAVSISSVSESSTMVEDGTNRLCHNENI